ncbi:type II toxin-antitoxin system HicB family antitoxin [Exiguobacterium oxidotolerans]|uniref:type II toxin-antitoxin system HicB family antitoxin n=1 Tax=Exiguobacterium oxidotolerans TaxID=223958 RepID=UPI0004949380|nr:type II toxin-antitoxin system HicB family antitoxin [Exiguobacterium oxidotolerans]
MPIFKYYALVTPDLEDNCFLVSFPDLENVYTDGETLVEAVTHAEDALETMLEVMLVYGDEFNPPSPASAITVPEGASLIAVEVNVNTKGEAV